MTTLNMLFALRNETKGALRYEEIDQQGNVVPFASAVIGTVYIRKTALSKMRGVTPAVFTLTITTHEQKQKQALRKKGG